MPLSETEKVMVRTYLGYPNLGTAPLLAMGVPAAGHLSFLIENAMNYLLPQAEPRVREVLAELRCIEKQLSDVKSRTKAEKTGDVTLRATHEIEDLEDLFCFWVSVLEDIFSIGTNPFSFRARLLGTGGWTTVEPC